jgi:hypothetical protein
MRWKGQSTNLESSLILDRHSEDIVLSVQSKEKEGGQGKQKFAIRNHLIRCFLAMCGSKSRAVVVGSNRSLT